MELKVTGKVNVNSLTGVLSGLRNENSFRSATVEISEALSLKPNITVFQLKLFLIKIVKDRQNKIKEYDTDIVLVALGLLDGYYCDTEYIEGGKTSEVRGLGERRRKYLRYGPYIRTKRGRRYESYDKIDSEDIRRSIENALGRKEERLIIKLAKFIATLENLPTYIIDAANDSQYVVKHSSKGGIIRLPKQCCFLEDFPPPEEQPRDAKNTTAKAGLSETKATVSVNPEISQSTVSSAPLSHGWGDNDGGRPSYTLVQVQGGILGDTIVFNSISNSTIGNEKNFVAVREDTGIHAGLKNVWNAGRIIVENGKTYIIRLYVHNNNPNGLKSIAKDVRVAFSLPSQSGRQIRVTGYIRSSNATPSQYWASVVFCNDTARFHLEYIWGSARLENRGLGQRPSIKVSDDIVTRASTGGILVNYDTLDGSIPGCYKYSSYISIRVKAVFDFRFRVEQRVRLAGTDEWRTNVENAKVGDLIEFRILYTNVSDETQENIMIKNILPANLHYIPETTVLTNSNHTLNIDQNTIATTGINIGDYNSGANAFVDFTAKVVDATLQDGTNNLVNWSQCGVGQVVLQDYATVQVYK